MVPLDKNYEEIKDDDDDDNEEEEVEEPNDLIDKKLTCHFKVMIDKIIFNDHTQF